MSLPIFQGGTPEFNLMQTQWASNLDPLLKNPMSNGNFVNGVVLASGSNVINHKLGRTPQGWMITDRNGAATVYRSAAFNPLTLTLTASAAVTVTLYVF